MFAIRLFKLLGPHRFLLALLSTIFIILCFFVDIDLEPEGWGLLFGTVVPAVPPLLFMLYGLDLLMSRVWRNEYGDEERKRFDKISIFDIAMMIIITIVWLPIFLKN